MARFVVTSEPNEPRQGVFVIDAPDEKTARNQVMRDGLGDVVWSTRKPTLNRDVLESFGPAAQVRVEKFITKLQGEFAGAGSVMLKEGPLSKMTRAAGELGKRSALPVGGGIVGGIVSPLFGVPSPLGSAAGGALGEAANQVLGITPFDVEQIILSGAVGGASQVAGRALPVGPRVNVSPAVRRLPGASGAFTEIASEELRNVPQALEFGTQAILGNETIDSLFDFALQQQGRVPIPATNLRKMIARGLLTEKKATRFGLQFGQIKRILQKTSEQTQQGGKALTLEDTDLLRRRIGARIGRMAIDGEERNALRSLYRGIMDDLEEAATRQPGAAALVTAVKVARREFAARDFGDFLEQKIFGNPRGDGLRPIAIGRLKKEFDNMLAGRPSKTFELFEDSLTRQELDEIQSVINFWSDTLQPLPPPRGVQFGSGPTASAGATGFVLGGGPGAAGAVVAKNLLTLGLMSRNGRLALVNMIQNRQQINLTELGLAIAGTSARGMLPQGRQLMERFSAPQISAPTQ
ncbi:MAG: hypothetical protein ACR2QC_11850 [Gammaproteobacteria bacterium]